MVSGTLERGGCSKVIGICSGVRRGPAVSFEVLRSGLLDPFSGHEKPRALPWASLGCPVGTEERGRGA
jgi:hypothetical protein